MKTRANELALLERTTTMVKKGYNLEQSLRTSSMIELLQCKLLNGTAKFMYFKKDGSVRIAHGSLLEKVVERNINGCGEPRRFYNCQAYYDVEEGQWRSFKYENLITILN